VGGLFRSPFFPPFSSPFPCAHRIERDKGVDLKTDYDIYIQNSSRSLSSLPFFFFFPPFKATSRKQNRRSTWATGLPGPSPSFFFPFSFFLPPDRINKPQRRGGFFLPLFFFTALPPPQRVMPETTRSTSRRDRPRLDPAPSSFPFFFFLFLPFLPRDRRGRGAVDEEIIDKEMDRSKARLL